MRACARAFGVLSAHRYNDLRDFVQLTNNCARVVLEISPHVFCLQYKLNVKCALMVILQVDFCRLRLFPEQKQTYLEINTRSSFGKHGEIKSNSATS